jgi:hypothetical protein
MTVCPSCNDEIDLRDSERFCPSCNGHISYPNVRAAGRDDEVRALWKRFQTALSRAIENNCEVVFHDFYHALQESRAVICRSFSELKALLSNDNALYASFYNLLNAGARRPENTALERLRPAVDSLLFPFFSVEIRFAALALNGRGIRSYGECSIELKDTAIKERASVFEENSLLFCLKRKLGPHTGIPEGHRATWLGRALLAISKLQEQLAPELQRAQFASLLLKVGDSSTEEDFVEVHIYGPLNRGSVRRVIVPTPSHEEDLILLKQARKLLDDVVIESAVSA